MAVTIVTKDNFETKRCIIRLVVVELLRNKKCAADGGIIWSGEFS